MNFTHNIYSAIKYGLTFIFFLSVLSCQSSTANKASVYSGAESEPRLAKRTVAMRSSVYERLIEIQKIVESKNHDDVESQLEDLLEKGVGNKPFNASELAHIYNMQAYIYYVQARYEDAVEKYKKILGLSPKASSQLRLQSLKALVMINNQLNRSEDAAAAMKQWVSLYLSSGGRSTWEAAETYYLVGEEDKANEAFGKAVVDLRTEISKPRIPKKAYEVLAMLYQSDSQAGELEKYRVIFAEIQPDIDHSLLIDHFSGNKSPESYRLVEKLFDNYLPIVKVAPLYPQSAMDEKLEGYCVVEYTVSRTGSVINPEAIDCAPKGYFEEASIRATLKFKYKPRVVDFKAVDTEGVQNRFTFELGD